MRQLNCTLGLAVILLVPLSASATSTYDFENLSAGGIAGQDNWVQVLGDLAIETGTGSNTSLILSNTSGIDARDFRQNDANFSFSFTGNETNAFMQFDTRWLSGAQQNFGTQFWLTGSGTFISPLIGVKFDQFGATTDGILFFNGVSFTSAHAPSGVQVGDWVRVRFEMDFTANGGDGLGSFLTMNLTQGDTAFTPLSALQNLGLGMVAQGTNPALWDTMNILIPTGQSSFDNLAFGIVPEPSTGLLLGIGLAGLAFRSRRQL